MIESVSGLFGKDLIAKISSAFGENEAGVRQAVNGVIPTVLAGLLQKEGSGDVQGIIQLAKDATGSFDISKLGSLLSSGNILTKGGELLNGLFGNKTASVAKAISSFSGIRHFPPIIC